MLLNIYKNKHKDKEKKLCNTNMKDADKNITKSGNQLLELSCEIFSEDGWVNWEYSNSGKFYKKIYHINLQICNMMALYVPC